jgi:hypothetical protein
MNTHAFCAGRGTCILFLEDSLAAFGTLSSLKEILEVRQGFSLRLNSNRDSASLLDKTQRHAPVRGVLFGSQLNTTVSDLFGGWVGLKSGWPLLSANISAVSYSVELDSKAHVDAAIQCTSKSTAALLSTTLNALCSLNSIASLPVRSAGSPPFQIMQVSSSSDIISIKADCALP